jgi:peptide/nickel transport system permease protein
VVRYIIRRLLWVVVLLVAVSFITFLIFYWLPTADPAQLRAGRQPNPELVKQIRDRLGLDDPFLVQYWHYMQRLVFHFDFGYSYQNNADVKTQLFDRLPASVAVAIGAAVVWLLTGIAVGIISAVRSRSVLDRTTMTLSLVAISAPVYWLGLVVLYLFAADIGKFPVSFFKGAGSYVPFSQDPATWFQSLLLPWFVLAAGFAALYARLLRANLIEVMSEDYIRTARAKGLSERRVVLRHGVRSAITPIITALGLDLGVLLGGTILVETVFNIPGVGRYAYDGIQNADIPVIQGTVLLGAFFIVMANLVVDIIYAFLDPRVRYS